MRIDRSSAVDWIVEQPEAGTRAGATCTSRQSSVRVWRSVVTKRTWRRAWQWRPGAMALADPVRTLGETADPAVASRATALKWRRLVGSTEGWRVVGRVGDAGVSA